MSGYRLTNAKRVDPAKRVFYSRNGRDRSTAKMVHLGYCAFFKRRGIPWNQLPPLPQDYIEHPSAFAEWAKSCH